MCQHNTGFGPSKMVCFLVVSLKTTPEGHHSICMFSFCCHLEVAFGMPGLFRCAGACHFFRWGVNGLARSPPCWSGPLPSTLTGWRATRLGRFRGATPGRGLDSCWARAGLLVSRFFVVVAFVVCVLLLFCCRGKHEPTWTCDTWEDHLPSQPLHMEPDVRDP